MKCDNCEFQHIHIVGDYGVRYCAKGNWDTEAPLDEDENEEEQDDPWAWCIDYKPDGTNNNQQ